MMVRRNPHSLRARAWHAARELRVFTLHELARATGCSTRTAGRLAAALTSAGALHIVYAAAAIDPHESKLTVYRAGLPVRTSTTVSGWKRDAWRAIRIYKRFSAVSILRGITSGPVQISEVAAYIEALVQVGVVAPDSNNGIHDQQGPDPDQSAFVLAIDLGAAPPDPTGNEQVQRRPPSTRTHNLEALGHLLTSIRWLYHYPQVFHLPQAEYPCLEANVQDGTITYRLADDVAAAFDGSDAGFEGNPEKVAALDRLLHSAADAASFRTYVGRLEQWYDTLGRVGFDEMPPLAPDRPFPYPRSYAARRLVLHRWRALANRLDESMRQYFLDDLGRILYGHRPGECLVERLPPPTDHEWHRP